MVRRIILMKFTDQGVKNIKDAPQRFEQATKMVEKMGGKMQLYATTGEYDLIAIAEAPSEEAGMAAIMGICAQGNVRTTTCNAFTMEEFLEIIKKLP
ncbi:MAG: GYD domain-containing protein [Actinobacteria bacterium]|nr:GYD domain-containing protein [Actinomycetota bacterium]